MVNEIQLHRLDLNLLVTFETLMDVRSVTVAADKLGKTPSAVSHALARLRDQLDDPLMVKVGGKMQPSPFALKLIEDVRPILRSIQRVISPPQPFVPAQSDRQFRLAIPTIPGFMSRVFERVNAQAPDISLEWTSPNQRTFAQVAEGLIDLAMMGSTSVVPDGVVGRVLPVLKVYVFARSGHPALDNWTRQAWLRWPHIMIGMGGAEKTTVVQRSLDLALERKIGARVPDFGAAAPLLARTNFLFNNFNISMIDDIEPYNLRILQSPIGPVDGYFKLMWSARLANDPALQWLRQIVIQSYESLVETAEEKFSQADIIMPRD